jgi:hypothetical protein
LREASVEALVNWIEVNDATAQYREYRRHDGEDQREIAQRFSALRLVRAVSDGV